MSTQSNAVDQLNSFLRGEISAVETYRQAADALKTSQNVGLLNQWRQSHENRVQLLRSEIQKLGGTPSEGSGAWGAFTKLVEGGASVLGEKAAIAALEEGEDIGLKDYRGIDKLEPPVRSFVQQQILPEQQKTHDGLRDLKKRLASS